VRFRIVARLLQMVVVVWLVVTISFILIHAAPGDPFALDDPRVSAAIREQWRNDFGLDRPLAEQYVVYLRNVARGDLGWSFSQHVPVRDAIARALPRTLLLMGVAIAGSLLLGIALGVHQVVRRGRIDERVARGTALLFYSVPDFWLALVALLALSYWFPIFPAGGMIDPVLHEHFTPWGRFVDRARHLALPAITLTLLTAAAVARYQRAALLEVYELDFVRTARAKGLPESGVVRHAIRNALLPVITIVGLMLPAMVGGAVFIEKVFSWPGMGLLTINAVATRDYPLVTAAVAVGGVMVTIGSFVADTLYAVADPRVRSS
jgi:peptide/nickel transport system permease protein